MNEDDEIVEKIKPSEYWKCLTSKKVEYNEDSGYFKDYSPQSINKYASMINAYLPIASEICKYPYLPKSVHYAYYYSLLPKKYIKFEYVKGDKDKKDKERKEYIAKYFEIGRRDVDLANKLLSDEDIIKIKKTFGKI